MSFPILEHCSNALTVSLVIFSLITKGELAGLPRDLLRLNTFSIGCMNCSDSICRVLFLGKIDEYDLYALSFDIAFVGDTPT